MKQQAHEQFTFQPYEQGQMMLLPTNLEEFVPDGHPVRVVSQSIDQPAWSTGGATEVEGRAGTIRG